MASKSKTTLAAKLGASVGSALKPRSGAISGSLSANQAATTKRSPEGGPLRLVGPGNAPTLPPLQPVRTQGAAAAPVIPAPATAGAATTSRSPEDAQYNSELAQGFLNRDTGIAKDNLADQQAKDAYSNAYGQLANNYAKTKENTLNTANKQGLFYSGILGQRQGDDQAQFDLSNTGLINTENTTLDSSTLDREALQKQYGYRGKMVTDPYTGAQTLDSGVGGQGSLGTAISRQLAADSAAAAAGNLAGAPPSTPPGAAGAAGGAPSPVTGAAAAGAAAGKAVSPAAALAAKVGASAGKFGAIGSSVGSYLGPKSKGVSGKSNVLRSTPLRKVPLY